MTKKWSAIVDSGIDSKTSKLEIDGERLNFKSELAIVNYLIANGWEVYQIDEIDKGSVNIGGLLLGSSAAAGAGGSVKISKTRYIMTKIVQ